MEFADHQWINRQYKEIRRSVLNKMQVVISGHSHGGLLTTIFAEMLDKDPTIPQNKLNNFYVVTFNSIQIIPRTTLKRIKLLYQFANTADVAQAKRRGSISRLFNISRNINVNNMFDPEVWNSSQYNTNRTTVQINNNNSFGNNANYKPLPSNLHMIFDKDVSKVYYNKRYSMLWLWKKVPARKDERVAYLRKIDTDGKTIGVYFFDFPRLASDIRSHIDYNLDKFVSAVVDMFKRRIALNIV